MPLCSQEYGAESSSRVLESEDKLFVGKVVPPPPVEAEWLRAGCTASRHELVGLVLGHPA